MSTLILAVNMREASEYAQLAGLQKHTWRAPMRPDDVRGVRPERVIVLPGYARKGNRFAINSEVRKREMPDTERVIVTDDDIAALREAAKPALAESKWSGPYGDTEPLFDYNEGGFALPKKPVKRAAAKKVTVPPTPEADFF